MKKYKAMKIANYIIRKCSEDGCPITNLQLQKIMYFLQREYLQSKNVPLFDDEIQAWQFGPVVPEVYYRYCVFGAMPITIIDKMADLNKCDADIINPIIEEKRKLYPWDLVEETHQEGGAWDTVYDNGRGNRKVIPTEFIKARG